MFFLLFLPKISSSCSQTFRAFGAGWRYDWQSDGMLSRVVRPDGKEVSFAYDALGIRRDLLPLVQRHIAVPHEMSSDALISLLGPPAQRIICE